MTWLWLAVFGWCCFMMGRKVTRWQHDRGHAEYVNGVTDLMSKEAQIEWLRASRRFVESEEAKLKRRR